MQTRLCLAGGGLRPALWGAQLGLLLVLAALLTVGCDRESGRKGADPSSKKSVTQWKMTTAFSAELPVLGSGAKELAESLNTLSQGRLSVEFFDVGTLVPSLQVFGAVSRGELQAAWSSAEFWTHRIPAAAFFSGVPFGPDTVEYLAWLYEGGGLQLWRDLYRPHKIRPIPCGLLPPRAAGWFREPIMRAEQLRGLKVRYGGLGGMVLQKLGASVLPLSGSDLIPALQEGLLDGTEFYMPVLDEQAGLYKIVKYYHFPGWQRQTSVLELLVNEDAWAALAAPEQALLEAACRDSIVRGITRAEATQSQALEGMSKAGVQVHYWSADVLQTFRKTYQEVVQEQSSKDEDFRRAAQSLSAFRERYDQWARISRLPQ